MTFPAGPAAAHGFVTIPEPDPPALLCLRHARAAVASGDAPLALAWLDHALALDPGLGIAHATRVLLLQEMGEHLAARRALEHAMTQTRGADAVPVHLARMCLRQGDAREAMDLLATAVALAPEAAPQLVEDETFASLRDHPRFLQIVGRL